MLGVPRRVGLQLCSCSRSNLSLIYSRQFLQSNVKSSSLTCKGLNSFRWYSIRRSLHTSVMNQDEAGASSQATSADAEPQGNIISRPQASRLSVIIGNMMSYPGEEEVKDWIRDITGVVPKAVFTRGSYHNKEVVATLRSPEEQQQVVARLHQNYHQGQQVTCTTSQPNVAFRQRGKKSQGRDAPSAKRVKVDTLAHLAPEERVSRSIEPLKHLPYEDQLKRKAELVSNELKAITSEMAKSQLVPPWLPQQRAAHGGLICKLLEPLVSPSLDQYRIKVEFSIGPGPEEDKPLTIGFHSGLIREGQSIIINPTQCSILKEKAKEIAQVFEVYLRQSDLVYYDDITNLGYWKTLTVRTPEAGGCMVILQMHPQGQTQADVDSEIRALSQYFTEGPGKDAGITSMYLHFENERYRKSSKLTVDYHHVFGDHHIHEQLMGLNFRISPSAFFQVNNGATERLYSTICDWCNVSANSVVLDICCGTGTIALALAKKVKKVIGIELCEQAVEDARHNAEANGISNAEFICGRAEHVLPDLVKRFGRRTELIAVLDPPRAGALPSVLKAIRQCTGLKRLVFVACDLKQSKDAIVRLCRPPNSHVHMMGFRPDQAVMVDMFPHTPHCEVAILLNRVTPPKLSDFVKKDEAAAAAAN